MRDLDLDDRAIQYYRVAYANGIGEVKRDPRLALKRLTKNREGREP